MLLATAALAGVGFAVGRPGVKPIRAEGAVWAVDDGHRVAASDGEVAAMAGRRPGAWAPGRPIELFGLPGETLAFQIVVSAGNRPVDEATVTVTPVAGPALAVDRFVVLELAMERRSGGRDPSESLGWTRRARPPGPDRGGLPDPLVPVERAPGWANYPMTVATQHHRVVWVDVTVPREAPPGRSRSVVTVEGRVAGAKNELAHIPLSIDVGKAKLPYRAVATMVYFEPERVRERAGDDAVDSAWQVLHRHRLTAIAPIRSPEDVRAQRDALTGRLFTRERGYVGPGEGVGSDVVAIGAYGTLGDPRPAALANVEAILQALADIGIEDELGVHEVFLYVIDEQCQSPRAAAWKRALAQASSPRLRGLRSAQTCSEPPAGQPVDIAMVQAGSYPGGAKREGQAVWIYNGSLPHTGAFLSDSWPISLRANAWIQAWHGIPRWFYWEASFWNDDNRGGRGPYDPLLVAETFHNADGDHANGDGVLFYPGRGRGGYRDLDIAGVVGSIRLAQWRRGIEDAGYIALAREVDRAATDAVVGPLVRKAFEATHGPSWPTDPEPWLEARRQLFDIIERTRPRGPRRW